jgi:hypothetical protein
MTVFTGRFGTANSLYGQIVLAEVDGFPVGINCFVHQLTSRTIRVFFGIRVTSSALLLADYGLIAINPSDTVVPAMEFIEFYDEKHDSVLIRFFNTLTSGKDYSLSITDVVLETGDTVINAARNFTANVLDPPRAIGAFLSKRGFIDILFDKAVGQNSGAAIFEIRDSVGGPGVPMIQASWGPEDILDTILRIQLPTGMPIAEAYIIDFTDVIDVSLNSSSESIPLTLKLRSSTPYSYSNLTQLQLIDAYVTDVSSDYLRTSTIRVYFNCPVLDSVNELNWTIAALGAHPRSDIINYVTFPDANDEASLISLVNDIKATFNAHLVLEQVHNKYDVKSKILSPDAGDLLTAIDLLTELQIKYLTHLAAFGIHLYNDTINKFNVVSIPTSGPQSLILAIQVANENLKPALNSHLLPEYSLEFSNEYGAPLGPITSYASEIIPDSAFDVSGPFTYFADLHVILDVDIPDIHITANLQSEDSGSSTNPSDFTGSIIARSASTRALLTSILTNPSGSVNLDFDKELILISDVSIKYIGPTNIELSSQHSLSSSFPFVLWAYNNAVEAFNRHIVFTGHQQPDYVNTVIPTDYAVLPLSGILDSINSIRAKIINHMSNSLFHYFADMDLIRYPIATDMVSFIALVSDIQRVLSAHTQRVGPHSVATPKIISAPLFNRYQSNLADVKDGTQYNIVGNLRSHYEWNGLQFPVIKHDTISNVPVNINMTGIAIRPSLASAVPKSGVVFENNELKLEPDSVDIFFSKSMHKVPLTSSNIQLTGGDLQQKDSKWTSDSAASVVVAKMQIMTYNVTIVGLTDVAGNSLY